MADLSAAIIGYGLAGEVFHAPLLAATPGAVVASVVTGDAERGARVRAAHPGAQVLASAEELWARASEHDLVVVATPNATHVELAMAAIDRGLPVVVDKPLAIEAGAARRLVEHARTAGVPLTVFHNRRWDADQLTLRRLLDEGRLGRVLRCESRMESWAADALSSRWRLSDARAAGGGILLDLGAHLVDQALTLFGPVATVYAEIDRRAGGADDDVFLALRHVGGARSHLHASDAVAPGPRLRVTGARAVYEHPAADGQEAALAAGRWPGGAVMTGAVGSGSADGPAGGGGLAGGSAVGGESASRSVTGAGAGRGWGAVPEAAWGRLVVGETSEAVAAEPGGWDRFYPAVVAALRGGSAMPVAAEDAVAVLEVLGAARLSAEQGRVVALRD